MTDICVYLQVHQPFRLSHYRVFDIGHQAPYFDEKLNKQICRKVAKKSYLPTCAMLETMLHTYPDFHVNFSITGVAIEQFEEYAPEVIEALKRLVATGRVELMGETYHHSLAVLFSEEEFAEQVKLHTQCMRRVFGVTPRIFRNTELIYTNKIAALVKRLGFQAIVTEGVDRILDGRSPNHLYWAKSRSKLPMFLKNYKLSDDIAFRFSDKDWKHYPLSLKKYAGWMGSASYKSDVINLFMDWETFGEHQWEESGIFQFFTALPGELAKNKSLRFSTLSQALERHHPVDTYDVPHPISWADSERDISAWVGNPMQDTSIAWAYRLEEEVKKPKNRHLLPTWRKLLTSDHFYYLCTKHWQDGNVHAYFSPYNKPHQGYMYLTNVLADLESQLT